MKKKRNGKLFVDGKKIAEVDVKVTRPRIHIGRHKIMVEATHDSDGSVASNSVMHADMITNLVAKDKWELAEKLRRLADQVVNTESDFDEGLSMVYVGRTYSHAALKRFGG